MAGIDNGFHQRPGEFILVQRSNQFGDGPASAHTGGQLDEQLSAGFMDLVHKDLQFFEHLGVLPQPLTPECVTQRCDTGDDQAYIVICSFQKQLSSFLIKSAAGQLKPAEEGSATHGTHDDAVFDFHIANFPGGK